mgnify:CR=1 FL=1
MVVASPRRHDVAGHMGDAWRLLQNVQKRGPRIMCHRRATWARAAQRHRGAWSYEHGDTCAVFTAFAFVAFCPGERSTRKQRHEDALGTSHVFAFASPVGAISVHPRVLEMQRSPKGHAGWGEDRISAVGSLVRGRQLWRPASGPQLTAGRFFQGAANPSAFVIAHEVQGSAGLEPLDLFGAKAVPAPKDIFRAVRVVENHLDRLSGR